MTTITAIDTALNMTSFIDFNLMFLPLEGDVGTNMSIMATMEPAFLAFLDRWLPYTGHLVLD